jgi:N-acyl-L-homoserine lactone synthetase
MKFYRRIIINRGAYFSEKNGWRVSFHSVFIFAKYDKKHFHYLIKEKTVFFKIDLLKFEALILAAKNLP